MEGRGGMTKFSGRERGKGRAEVKGEEFSRGDRTMRHRANAKQRWTRWSVRPRRMERGESCTGREAGSSSLCLQVFGFAAL